jgi:foldase protein PrsA
VFKVLRLAPALGAVLFALVGLSACGGGGGIPGNAVAKVGGSSITTAEFKHWMTVAAISGSRRVLAKHPVAPEPPNYTACIAHLKEVGLKERQPGGSTVGKPMPPTATLKKDCEYTYKSLSQEVLSFLISSEWELEEANSLGVKLSDKEVEKEFVKIRTKQFPKTAELEKYLQSSGQTVSDLLLRVKLSLLSQKIQQKIIKDQVKPTQAEMQKYYNEHKLLYSVPANRAVEIILTKTEAAAKSAKKEVESGKSFASVAKRVSIDPTSKANGGLLPKVFRGQGEKALDTAIFSASKNVLSGPVKTPLGYYIFDVLASTPASQKSLAQLQASIKDSLASSRQKAAISKFVKDFKTKWTGKTDCRTGYVVAECKQYKAPKTSSTATP